MGFLVCGCLNAKTPGEVIERASRHKDDVDLFEVRLDALNEPSDIEFLADITVPLMATLMPKWEGGAFTGPEEERIRILENTLSYCDFVTVELATEKTLRDKLVKAAKAQGVQVVVSKHDFESTPPQKDIESDIRDCLSAGADIAKVAYTAKNLGDVVSLLTAASLFAPGRVLPLSMGDSGRISRILAPALGSPLTYAALAEQEATAPGQYLAGQLKAIRPLLAD